VGQFSDDGQWWWDGASWVATAQVVIPQLPPTEFEQAGKAQEAQRRAKKGGRVWAWTDPFPALAALRVVAAADLLPALRDYRSWKLEQMALATTYLLGPDEPMLAGEVATVTRDEQAPVLGWRSPRRMSWFFASSLSTGNRDGSRWQGERPT